MPIRQDLDQRRAPGEGRPHVPGRRLAPLQAALLQGQSEVALQLLPAGVALVVLLLPGAEAGRGGRLRPEADEPRADLAQLAEQRLEARLVAQPAGLNGAGVD